MNVSRDDFVIAIRSAFLKKQTKQKFSLLSLITLSIIILILSSFDYKIIKTVRSGINEIIYRGSFVISAPEKIVKNLNTEIRNHFGVNRVAQCGALASLNDKKYLNNIL